LVPLSGAPPCTPANGAEATSSPMPLNVLTPFRSNELRTAHPLPLSALKQPVVANGMRYLMLSLELSAALGPQQEEQCEESGFGG
jgi:hypothetical protein